MHNPCGSHLLFLFHFFFFGSCLHSCVGGFWSTLYAGVHIISPIWFVQFSSGVCTS